MKPSTIQKNQLKSVVLSLTGFVLLSLSASCTVDEIETLPNNNSTAVIVKEKFLQKDASTISNRGDDYVPPVIIATIPPKKP